MSATVVDLYRTGQSKRYHLRDLKVYHKRDGENVLHQQEQACTGGRNRRFKHQGSQKLDLPQIETQVPFPYQVREVPDAPQHHEPGGNREAVIGIVIEMPSCFQCTVLFCDAEQFQPYATRAEAEKAVLKCRADLGDAFQRKRALQQMPKRVGAIRCVRGRK